eukprot:405095-Prorocentrum_lima.AAC.1
MLPHPAPSGSLAKGVGQSYASSCAAASEGRPQRGEMTEGRKLTLTRHRSLGNRTSACPGPKLTMPIMLHLAGEG